MKGDGFIAKAVANEFRLQFPRGLPHGELDGIYSSAAEWVEKHFEERISVSTARRYLKDLPRAPKNTEN